MFNFLRKLFSPNETPLPETTPSADSTENKIKTQPLSMENNTPPLYPAILTVGCAQSVGKQRDHNEDSLFCFTSTLADSQENYPLSFFVVADGMGGHEHGEAASGAAVRVMASQILHNLPPLFLGVGSASQSQSIQEIMEDSVQEAQRAVLRYAPGGGTTLTSALIIGEQITMAHVGDSRLYLLLADKTMRVLSKDHSFVNKLREMGEITEEDAKNHPQKNVLYRALGQPDPLSPDIATYIFPAGATIMLCSDGLWGVVEETEIVKIITSAPDLSKASQALVQAANDAGGPDNISVILARLAR